MEYQTLGMIVGAVMIVAALLYVLDRRAKAQAVDYTDLGKIVAGSGVFSTPSVRRQLRMLPRQ